MFEFACTRNDVSARCHILFAMGGNRLLYAEILRMRTFKSVLTRGTSILQINGTLVSGRFHRASNSFCVYFHKTLLEIAFVIPTSRAYLR